MVATDIPDIVVGRLPLYLRMLARLAAEGKEITSSHEMGKALGISSAQIRKDLSHFGEFGKQGTGYHVQFLTDQLKRILHLEHEWGIALVGLGNLGRALANYDGFSDRGLHITHLFDNSPDKIGRQIGKFEVLPTSSIQEVVAAAGIQVAMLAVPSEHAQDVCEKLVTAGVRAILNYAPTHLHTPDDVYVQDIDPVVHLQHMLFYLDS